MQAIGYAAAGPIDADDALIAFETARPTPGPRDLLVEVRGVSVNPVDTKVRAGIEPENGPRILGFDGAGVVAEAGAEVTWFRPGDQVFYAGDISRPGTNAEFHLVDERIVGRMPTSMDFADAAGMPLTCITAWELLFDTLGVAEGGGKGDTLLVIGGAGGVGSVLIQLAKRLTKLKVIATASRPDTVAWVETMGADHIVNHRKPLDGELSTLGIAPRYVACLTHTADHFDAVAELIKPRGRIAVIDDPPALEIKPLKKKALSVGWEYMFARPVFQTADMHVQHDLLNRVAAMLDDGSLLPTVYEHAGALTVDALTEAHAFQESGRAIGKTVFDGLGR
ncbi:zinc-binding alcohol dehydrogenase family protein [Alienimonas chondri]|uniref:Zinc-type alcohol dehydrogenase-like protein n=1 Tax=Alienimonas chondri TaxID=2681879 RepID=A0ABX1VHQ2_9PLAN|nr:zinc-binding alcohol dehydrogenase family protein [Alienimonas chondri]NNJ27378.1 Zinc-type alcohol dehydrogenase-like protein [Alienimonas chondri]